MDGNSTFDVWLLQVPINDNATVEKVLNQRRLVENIAATHMVSSKNVWMVYCIVDKFE